MVLTIIFSGAKRLVNRPFWRLWWGGGGGEGGGMNKIHQVVPQRLFLAGGRVGRVRWGGGGVFCSADEE